jgi:dipeptidyl aminopeptidase/acylaminoacyl peptidase
MRLWKRALPLAALCVWHAGFAAVEKLPVETFSKQFKYQAAALSPDGTRLAVSSLGEEVTVLAVVDVATGKGAAVAGVKNPDTLGGIWWKSDRRILYRSIRHDTYNSFIPVLMAVDMDGSNKVMLNFNPQLNGLYTRDYLVDIGWEDAGWAYIASETARPDYPVVYRVNVQKSKGPGMGGSSVDGVDWPTSRKALFLPPGRECSYQADNAGVIRTCLTSELDNTNRLLYRRAEGDKWRELASFTDGAGLISPIGFTPDNRQMYVFSGRGRDTVALFLYDPESAQLGELLFEAEGVDLDDVIYAGDGRLPVGVTYYKKGMGVFYLDPAIATMHQSLNKAFPGLQAQVLSFSRDNSRVLAWVGSSATPGAYYLMDQRKNEVRKVTDIAPWIQREKMAATRAIAYDARDGMRINGYLTLPRDVPSTKLPLIVNVHGGPHGVRDIATFDRETQLFANRGYAVLQVNYRGSGGYGREFRTAGHREWGGKMQQDLIDGVSWLVGQGTVDPDRVGIFGASYGGYAAMMALITSPEIFKCGATQAGVSNLVRMLNARYTTARSGLRSYVSKDTRLFWETVIGDRNDEKGLEAISPLFNVDKIEAPVFIAHGADDLVVPSVEATDLERAMRKAGKPVDMLLIPREGHGFSREDSRTLFFRKLDEFYAKHLPAG